MKAIKNIWHNAKIEGKHQNMKSTSTYANTKPCQTPPQFAHQQKCSLAGSTTLECQRNKTQPMTPSFRNTMKRQTTQTSPSSMVANSHPEIPKYQTQPPKYPIPSPSWHNKASQRQQCWQYPKYTNTSTNTLSSTLHLVIPHMDNANAMSLKTLESTTYHGQELSPSSFLNKDKTGTIGTTETIPLEHNHSVC